MNGWQRLWIVATVLLVAWALLHSLVSQQSMSEEDLSKILPLFADEGTPHFVPGVGTVTFPSHLAPYMVENYVEDGLATTPETVTSTAKLLMETAQKNALRDAAELSERAKYANESARRTNKTLWVIDFVLATVASGLLYAIGWVAGWVRRGFRS